MEQRYMNRKDTAEYLGVSPRTINRWVKDKGLPQILFADDGHPRYDKVAVDEWVQRYKIGG